MRRLALLLTLSAAGAGLIAAAALAARTHDAPCPARGTVWAVERFDTGPNTLAAFDAATGDVKGVVTIGKRPIGVVAPRHTGKVYTADERSNQLTVVSKRDFSTVTHIPMGALPHHMMATRDGRTIYVGEYGTNKIGVVDTETDTLVAEYEASADPAAHTHAVWISRDGDDLYATNEGATTSAAGTLSKLDARTGVKEWEVPIGLRPSEVLVSGKTAYVTIRNENKVKVLDLRGGLPSLVAEVAIGGMPDTMQLTKDKKTLVVGLRTIPQMALMDTRTLVRSPGHVHGLRHQRAPVALAERPLHVHRARERRHQPARRDRRGRQPLGRRASPPGRTRAALAARGLLRPPGAAVAQQVTGPAFSPGARLLVRGSGALPALVVGADVVGVDASALGERRACSSWKRTMSTTGWRVGTSSTSQPSSRSAATASCARSAARPSPSSTKQRTVSSIAARWPWRSCSV